MRLEVAFLDDDQAAPEPDTPVRDAQTRMTILIVAAELDVRRYVRECLRARHDIRIIEASTASAAVAIAARDAPDLLVVDEPERDAVERLSRISAIVIVDEVPYGSAPSGARVLLLGRPFSADQLMAAVDRISSRRQDGPSEPP